MEVKELMVGDWVEMNLSPSVSQQYYFKSKIEFSNLVSLENGYDFDASPIPLTEEILKANGFRIDSIGRHYAIFNDEYPECLFCVTIRKNGFWIPVSFYGKGTILNYVHELQHALRLCGLNEFADNFKIE